MKGALIILIATIILGILIYFFDKHFYRKRRPSPPEDLSSANSSDASPGGNPSPSSSSSTGGEEECCGMHAVCEKTSLSPLSTEAEYYDDEELDRFRGRSPEDYTEDEVEEFREILMTLLPSDVAGWSRSLQIREIALPEEVRDELLLIVRELRDEASSQSH